MTQRITLTVEDLDLAGGVGLSVSSGLEDQLETVAAAFRELALLRVLEVELPRMRAAAQQRCDAACAALGLVQPPPVAWTTRMTVTPLEETDQPDVPAGPVAPPSTPGEATQPDSEPEEDPAGEAPSAGTSPETPGSAPAADSAPAAGVRDHSDAPALEDVEPDGQEVVEGYPAATAEENARARAEGQTVVLDDTPVAGGTSRTDGFLGAEAAADGDDAPASPPVLPHRPGRPLGPKAQAIMDLLAREHPDRLSAVQISDRLGMSNGETLNRLRSLLSSRRVRTVRQEKPSADPTFALVLEGDDA